MLALDSLMPRAGQSTLTRCALLVAALLAASTAHAPCAYAEDALEITLEVGEQRVLPSEGVTSYSEGDAGIVDVRLTRDGGSFVLVGVKPGRTSLLLMLQGGASRLYRIEVTPQGGGRPTSDTGTAVQARDNVRLDFYFVQLSRDGGMQAGVGWPASYGGGSASASIDLMSGTFTQATAAITDQALPRLDLAQAAGWAKLLRQAAVITANGSEASFSGGGEVNIPVQSALNVGVRQIAFGSQIKVLPRYDRDSGRIELAIHAEVSDLTSDRGSGIPGRVTSTLDSVVNLELGQSIALAGLTARSETDSTTGLPGLSQIPILAALFGTRGTRSEHTENLIFIVPSVVDAVSLDARERVREALHVFDAYEGDMQETPLRGADATRGVTEPREVNRHE